MGGDMKRKALGTIEYPTARLESCDTTQSTATIKIEGINKSVRVKMDIGCARKLVDLAREITGNQRDHAVSQWNKYLHLKDYTGFKPPEGQQ
jgi:hypothetical protein